MANSRTGKKGTPNGTLKFEEISVDTDPGAGGYATSDVGLNEGDTAEFYISAITGATVHLQWKRAGATTWTDYDSYTVATLLVIEAHSDNEKWQSIVKDDNQGTSSVSGIRW